MNIVIAILLVFALVGLIDKITGNRFGLGYEFDKGIDIMGSLALALVGISCIGVYAAAANADSIARLAALLPFDPAILVGCLLAPDMGAMTISLEIASSRAVGIFAGMIVATSVGVTLCFQLPICVAAIKDFVDRNTIMRGFIIGIISIIPGIILGAFMLGLSFSEVVLNTLPVLILCLIVEVGSRVSAKTTAKTMIGIASGVRILTLVLFALVILGIFVEDFAIADAEVVKDTFVCCAKMAAVVCGSMVFSKLALKHFKKPFSILARLMGTNEQSVMGILLGMTTTFAMLPLVPEMDRRGQLINGAFSVGGAYIIGGQMAYVSALTTGHEILVFFVTKIVFTVCACIAVCFVDRKKMEKKMKTIRVAAAVIQSGDKIFATQRGYGEFKGGWEFPGGKIEAGETPEAALKREILEELETEIKVGELLDTVEYDYPNFHLSMDCFLCEIVRGDLVLKEHEDAKWLSREELYSVDWLPADIALIEKIREIL